MSMTWKDLKDELIDLGFEEDDTYSEYKRIAVNSTNRAVRIIHTVVVPQIEDYLNGKWGYPSKDEDGKATWVLPKFKPLTIDVEDDTKINVPEITEPLVGILAAHYLWLDDDLTKATIYWNEYDDLKTQIIQSAKLVKKAKIVGGIG